MDTPEELNFEEALAELEGIVTRLEAGDLTLEESLALFERGQQLAEFCSKQLEDATLRVEQLTEHGEIVEIET
ncbi:MAG: exodeoxyribonuclease VII small subunit [Chloroflexota bacterium]